MDKIRPVAYRYTASGYKKWHYSESFPVCYIRKVKRVERLQSLYTREALEAVAEAVKNAAWKVAYSEEAAEAVSDIDAAAIINQLTGW